MNKLYGLKQIAPVWEMSERNARRIIKKYGIILERAGTRGHIKMTQEVALEIKKKIYSQELVSCPTLSAFNL